MEEDFASSQIDDLFYEDDQEMHAAELEVLQLKDNSILRGLVSLEEIMGMLHYYTTFCHCPCTPCSLILEDLYREPHTLFLHGETPIMSLFMSRSFPFCTISPETSAFPSLQEWPLSPLCRCVEINTIPCAD